MSARRQDVHAAVGETQSSGGGSLMRRNTKAPDGRKLLRGASFVMHEPVLLGNMWLRRADLIADMDRHGINLHWVRNSVLRACDERAEATHGGPVRYRCTDCGGFVGESQPWCGCGNDIDWPAMGWREERVVLPDLGEVFWIISPDSEIAVLAMPYPGYTEECAA